MEKPKRKNINDFRKCIIGISGCKCNIKPVVYNQACDDWEKYHEWYIKTYCVKKEDLPTFEEVSSIISRFETDLDGMGTYAVPSWNLADLARIIVERINGRLK